MTDLTWGGASPGRLKIKISLVEDKPEPTGRASWDVYGRRWLVAKLHLGYVNAHGRDDALAQAHRKWPEERHLIVRPA